MRIAREQSQYKPIQLYICLADIKASFQVLYACCSRASQENELAEIKSLELVEPGCNTVFTFPARPEKCKVQ